MEAVGTLAGGMSHEFNNILSVIMGTAELALKKLDPDDKNYKRLSRILKSTERAKSLTTQLLTFARKEKPVMRPVGILDIVSDITDILERSISKQMEVKLDISDPAPVVKGDQNQIQQALLNVCLNAVDAMDEGGMIELHCSETSLGEDYCSKNPDAAPGHYCLIRVSDTGPGISDENMKKVLEPFFTTKEKGKGTGLGLSVTLGIVQNHGGHMTLESGAGGGTAVSIYLPLSREEQVREGRDVPGEMRGSGEGILIVEDESELLDIRTEALREAGYLPKPALSGPRAIDIFRSPDNGIALVLLDIMMPEMDGVQVYRALKSIDPDVKVLVMSAYTDSTRAGELKKEGVKHFLPKPCSTPEMLEAIRKVIDS